MCHKTGNDPKKDKPKEPKEKKKDTGYKNHIIEYDDEYLDNSMAHE